ncbi:hypothetical protein BH20CHL7_BH20CHL7_04930 [soil metagenome]
MSSVTTRTVGTRTATNLAILGVVAGLAGGILFGVLMAMQDMLPMVAALVGAEDATSGFVVHLAISAGAGLLFGLAAAGVPAIIASPQAAAAAGAAYGAVWWVAGALIAMPMMLGMGEMVLAVGEPQVMSLIGHLIFGVATGLVLFAAVRQGRG